MLLFPASLLIGYLIGSVSFAVLIARSKGVDIFTVGSGNPGATNVMRSLGKPFGYGCFLLDAFKGIAAVFAGKGLSIAVGAGDPQTLATVALLGSILGHSFSLFLKFKGGKGVATTVGGLLALIPPVMAVGILAWVIVFYASRYVSLASLVLGVSLPISAVIFQRPTSDLILCVFLSVLILVRHRANIKRLMNGTENRSKKK